MSRSPAKRAARDVASSTPMKVLARAGFVANGVVHLMMGVLVLVVAFGGDSQADQSGAMRAIAVVPAGFVVLWLLAIALWALGAWYLVEAYLARGSGGKKWGERLGGWVKAAVYLILGAISAAIALGARPNSDRSAEDVTTALLTMPGGVFVLGATGLVIGIVGGAFVFIGAASRFRKQLDPPSGVLRPIVMITGVVGYIAKGIALAIIGILLLVAAVKVEPSTAGGLDAALAALLRLPYGPWLVAATGIGLIAYGLYCFFRARYAKLNGSAQ